MIYLLGYYENYNMQINAKKTKTMVVTRNEGIQAKLEHEGEYLDKWKISSFWVPTSLLMETALMRSKDV